jgi:protocatechuate 3,4-dioxygenase beta subunit
MNEDTRLSRLVASRRRALGLGGTLTLAGLLAACGGSDRSTDSSSGSTSASTSATDSARAVPTTTSVTDVVALLDKAKTCTMTQEETQGPYWFDVDSIRSDLREDRPGTVLNLALRVQDVSACSTGATAAPVANSVVEIWHCDAGGIYAGFETGSRGGAGGAPGGGPRGSGETSNGSYSVGDSEGTTTDHGTYLRGAQVADVNGIVQFTTVYPGWYPGRTVHIHLKVHRDKKTVLTTQMFMDEGVNAAVFAKSPYSDHTGRDVFNDDDNIYDDTGLLTVSRQGDSYLGVLNLGIDA